MYLNKNKNNKTHKKCFILVSELTHSLSWLNTSIVAGSYDKVINTSDKAMQHSAAIPTVSAHCIFTHLC